MNVFLLIYVNPLKSNRWGSILDNRAKDASPLESFYYIFWEISGRSTLLDYCSGGSVNILFPSFLIQVFIFHVESHPEYPWYEQCVTFNSFPTRAHEIVYAAFGMTMMYVLPLVVFIFTYGSILCEISQRSKESNIKG